MDKQMLKTWTFLLLCIVLPNFSVSASVDNKTKPNTLYEAVINKCPRLEKTPLRENWKDVFDNQCSNWTVIDGAKVLTEKQKSPIACLLLYESILSFCEHIKDIEVDIKEIIPTLASSKHNLSEICLPETGLASLKGTEHDISEFTMELKCVLICGILGSNGTEVSDICSLAYFFESFLGQKFREKLLLLRTNKPVQIETNKSEVVPEPVNNSQSKHLELEVPHQPNNVKPKLTVAGEQSHVKGPPEGPPPATVTNKTKIELQSKSKAAEVAPAQPQSILPNPLNNAEGDSEKQKQGKKEANFVSDQDSEHDANEENNELPAAADALPDVGGEENSDEKGQGDEPDQGGFPPEVEEDDQEKKNKLSEPPASKGKPSTLHDEPTSNLNTPEDDMDGDSYFFSYFSVTMCMVIVGYVGYHNRHKIMALLLEGKRGKRNGRSGRRPNSANYHKLDTNLEEAISSSCTKNPPSNIIY